MGCVHILLGRDNNQEWGTVNDSNLGFEDMCRACSVWQHSWFQIHGYFCCVQLFAPLPCLWAALLQNARVEALPHAAITLLQGCVLLLGVWAALRVALGMPGLNLRHKFLMGGDAALRTLTGVAVSGASPVPPHPAHGPRSHFSFPELSAPASVMLQQEWSPALMPPACPHSQGGAECPGLGLPLMLPWSLAWSDYHYTITFTVNEPNRVGG